MMYDCQYTRLTMPKVLYQRISQPNCASGTSPALSFCRVQGPNCLDNLTNDLALTTLLLALTNLQCMLNNHITYLL